MATTPIPVRIPLEWLPRLDEAATRLGTNRARLIAFCAQTFTEEFERRGVAMMPPDWPELLAKLDGRTRGLTYEIKPIERLELNKTNSAPSRPKTVEEAAAAEEALAEELAKKPAVPAPIYRAARRARRK